MTTTEQQPGMPKAWRDLIDGLTLMAKAQTRNDISPLHCAHDELTVCASPEGFSDDQLRLLEELGFHADEDEERFYSFRFGSA